jgi:vesicle coat complex subunit
MRDLKHKAIFETDPIVKRRAVDALATNGKKSIPYLHHVASSIGISDMLKAYVLEKIALVNTISPPDG